jgi:hypothetical protein
MAKTIARCIYLVGWFAFLASFCLAIGVGGGYIRISQPKAGDKLSGKVTVRAQVRGIEDLAYVIFGVDDSRPHSTNAEPYQYELDTTTLADGPHSLFAEAHGKYGLLAGSAPVQVLVSNASAPKPRALVETPKSEAKPAARAEAEKPAPSTAAQPAAPAIKPAAKPSPEPPAPVQVIPMLPTIAMGTGDAESEQSTGPSAGGLLGIAGSGLTVPAAPLTATYPTAAGEKVVTLQPLMKGDLAFVRFRSMAEGLGNSVTWLHEKKTAVATTGTGSVEVTADSSRAVVNGKPFDMGSSAYLDESRLVAPGRSCAQMFGAGIAWNDKERTVRVSLTPEAGPQIAAR